MWRAQRDPTRTKPSEFQQTAPGQYGLRTTALAVYRQNGHSLPEARLVELFGDLFPARISAAMSAGMVRQAEQRWRDGTKRLHVPSTLEWPFYRTHQRRGSVLGGFRGCPVHDYWKSYFMVTNVRYQLCNAHY